ncbi:MAG: hypothetical protein L6R42_002474 [Xanthoria sp. 1 TBL-2021]|nr:MAG: hypothetical protein L6R42_002474 [Xanthoria sp. 1 TBL-2021]
MPLTTASHDSLPYIDPRPPLTGPHSLTAATTLINSLLPPSHTQTPHPSLPPLRPTNPTPLAQSEQSRIAAQKPLTGIDLSRYELDSPSLSTSPSTKSTQNLSAQLQNLHTASTYLRTRAHHLALLDRYGKNGWLVGNSQLEDLLGRMEREVVETRAEVEGVCGERKRVQEGRRGEMEGLERGWREGVGRVVEVEVAVGEVEGRRRGVLRDAGR